MMRFKGIKKLVGIGMLIAAMTYSGFTLIDPATTVSAATCCAYGSQCGTGNICCKPDPACMYPCNPLTGQNGYCFPSCTGLCS